MSHYSDGFKQTVLELLLSFANALDNLPGKDKKGPKKGDQSDEHWNCFKGSVGKTES